MDKVLNQCSNHDLRTLFRTAGCPSPNEITGRLKAELAGSALVRIVAPIAFRLTGLEDWWGKDLIPAVESGALTGFNLAGPGGERTTLALRAEQGPSRVDGRPAVIVSYPADAPWPWRRVVDELRILPDGTVLGLTFGLPLTSREGAPFLLRRETA